jgi:hypothetical protein
MKVTGRFPHRAGEIDVADLLDDLGGPIPGDPLRVGDPRVLDFLGSLGRRLLHPSVARRHPELGSLGFFLRRTEIHKALGHLDFQNGSRLRFPRGLVFHVPPANVDTIFVYSWALSALAGNRNVVRISSRSARAADAVLDALNATLDSADPCIAATQRMVTYGRDDEVTTALSRACDLRVLWGGDAAVERLRRHPLRPSARDLTFPDRASLSVWSVAGWIGASADQKQEAVEAFANDAYWFDQAACSSPRTLFWVGDPAGAAAASDEFPSVLAAVVERRGWGVDAAMAVEKRVATYGVAADGDAISLRFEGNSVAMLQLARPEAVPRRWLGAGTFPTAVVGSLADVAAVVVRRDQTLTHWGFSSDDVRTLAATLDGGIDRIVPVGQALTFAPVWDGYDLLHEFTRITTLQL